MPAVPGDSIVQILIGVVSGDDPSGGTIVGETGTAVICRNQTTSQQVTIPLGGGTPWDCEAGGLVVSPGDVISMVSLGSAN